MTHVINDPLPVLIRSWLNRLTPIHRHCQQQRPDEGDNPMVAIMVDQFRILEGVLTEMALLIQEDEPKISSSLPPRDFMAR